jgi:acyl dehydratase
MTAAAPAAPPPHAVTAAGFFSRRFDELNVGDVFTTPGRTIGEPDVVHFASWTGDTLPIHVDKHWAERHGMYGRRTANGLLVVSYTVGLLPLDGERVLALRRVRELVFKRPTFLGDTIHGRGEIQRLLEHEHFGCVITRLDSVNQHGEVVVRGRFEMLWRLDETPNTDPTEVS